MCEVKPVVEKNPGVKRVVVAEKQPSGNPQRDERVGSSAEPVQETVSDYGSRDGTGKGKGSSSESNRLEPKPQNAGEGRGQSRVECVAPSPEKGSAPCERFYIGDGPRDHQSAVVVTPEQVGNVVNPFWNQNHQREAVVEAFGPGAM